MKWFDTDTFREILDSILRNRSRSLLTGFGVFWGIFMLMLLIGGGQGLKQILMNEFDGFAQNTCIVFAGNTSKPYKGFKKGRSIMSCFRKAATLAASGSRWMGPITAWWAWTGTRATASTSTAARRKQ